MREIKRWMERVDKKLDERVVFRDVYESNRETSKIRFDAVKDDVKELKDNQLWTRRVLFTMLLAVIGEVILIVLKVTP